MESFESKKEHNKIEERIAEETKIADTLRADPRNKITNVELYRDPEQFGLKDFTILPVSIRQMAELLRDHLQNAIISDSVEGETADAERKVIRQNITDTDITPDKKEWNFYDGNKLQSSTVLKILLFVQTLAEEAELSSSILTQLEDVRHAFNGTDDPESFEAVKYKAELNNDQKMDVVRSATKLAEETLTELFKKYETK